MGQPFLERSSKYGILGIASGTMIPMLVTQLIIEPISICWVASLNYSEIGAPDDYRGAYNPVTLDNETRGSELEHSGRAGAALRDFLRADTLVSRVEAR